jgi:hypothetical protein
MSAAAPAAADAARPASTADVGARGVEGEAASGEMREAPPAPARAGAAAEDAAPGEAEAEAEAEAAEQTAASSSSNKGAAELRTPAFALARVGKIIKVRRVCVCVCRGERARRALSHRATARRRGGPSPAAAFASGKRGAGQPILASYVAD